MEALMLVVVLATAGTAEVQQPEQIVLFVCEHGAAKSVVAAAHFNQMAAERGLPFRAISRGTAPDATVPSRITEGLERDGLRLPDGFTPTALSGTDMSQAIRIVSFDVILPTMRDSSRSLRWDGLPAFSDGYDDANSAIRSKVESLIRHLQDAGKVKPKGQ
jgi:arsenate reductase (thioredoxin)